MCLVKSHKFPRRAQEDIICFKKLLCNNDLFITYFMGEPITSPIQKGRNNTLWKILQNQIFL